MTQQEYDEKMLVLEAELADRQMTRKNTWGYKASERILAKIAATRRKIERLKNKRIDNGDSNV